MEITAKNLTWIKTNARNGKYGMHRAQLLGGLIVIATVYDFTVDPLFFERARALDRANRRPTFWTKKREQEDRKILGAKWNLPWFLITEGANGQTIVEPRFATEAGAMAHAEQLAREMAETLANAMKARPTPETCGACGARDLSTIDFPGVYCCCECRTLYYFEPA